MYQVPGENQFTETPWWLLWKFGTAQFLEKNSSVIYADSKPDLQRIYSLLAPLHLRHLNTNKYRQFYNNCGHELYKKKVDEKSSHFLKQFIY